MAIKGGSISCSVLRFRRSHMESAFMFCVLTALSLISSILCSRGDQGLTTNALFIFGDSTVDVGNNNFIDTSPAFKANYSPYGKKAFPQSPTGRFGEGKIIVDFIAEYAGLPSIPPYGDRKADFTHGANFASGGAGILSETNLGKVLNLKAQLDNFNALSHILSERNGYIRTQELLSDAIYFISIGNNDYLNVYLSDPSRQDFSDAEQFVATVVGNLTEAIQLLYSKGARKIAYLGVGPLGCLPVLRSVAVDPESDGRCLPIASALGEAHNIGLSAALSELKMEFSELQLVYGNVFDFLTDRLENPTTHGFIEASQACCGSGNYRGKFTCGKANDNDADYKVCNNPSEHIWWDAYHPSELIHQQLATAIWNDSSYVEPVSLRHLFRSPVQSTLPISCSEDNFQSNLNDAVGASLHHQYHRSSSGDKS